MAGTTSTYSCTPNMIDLLDSQANSLTASPTKVTIVENTFEEVSTAPGVRSQATIRSNLEEGRDPSKLCNIPNIKKIDRFDELRPAPHSVISYKISQFDSKLERVGPHGLQEFHYVDTSMDYVPYPPGQGYIPPPVVKPKRPPQRGMGPCNEFLDDIWFRQVLERQEYYRRRLPLFIKKRKKEEAEAKIGEHIRLMKLIGPDWFQELSPSQLNTIDNLKATLVKDLKFNTVCNTIDSMTYLGIVPPPSTRLVKKVLKRSYNCPIEFLLFLYQLLDKDRTTYSLNDRLLLSSVVHLTMRETLKEMHIRLPSPPPPEPKLRRKSKKVPKPIKYKSPYLVPFTFKPEPRKHSGVYKNNHIQYPESPYFSYLYDLTVKEIFDTTIVEGGSQSKDPKLLDIPQQYGVTDELEKEIIGELRLAQYLYNNMNDNPNVPLLRKPTIYLPCDFVLPEVEPEPEPEPEPPVVDENQTNVTICVCVRVTTDYDEANKPVRKVCECDITCDEVEVARENDEVDIICNCQGEEEDEEEDDEESVSTTNRKVCKCDGSFDDEMTCGDSVVMCDCQDEDDDEEEEDITDFGVMETQTQENDPSTSVEVSVTKEPEGCICTAPKKWKLGEKLVTVASRPSLECTCKEVVQKQVDSRLCQCDRCKADRGELSSKGELPDTDKNLMTGRDETEQEDEEDGSSSFGKITCDCLEKYQKQVKLYEGVKKRMDVQSDLISLQKRYIIGGVTYTREGEPVYQLCGTVPKIPLVPFPKVECPQQPSGVPSHDCCCMKIYKSYMEKHSPCLDAYQEFLKKIELDTKEYMEELAADKRYQCECNDGEEEGKNDEVELAELMIKHIEERLSSKDERRDSDVADKSCICAPPSKKSGPPVDDIEIETELKLTLELNMDDDEGEEEDEEEGEQTPEEEPPFCVCDPRNDLGCVCGGADSEDIICDCGDEVEEDLNIASSLKRFTLLEKIPCNYEEQVEVIQRLLEGLAADGFPLAKLPECYKLPHFKLWMQLRCGKFWTQEDRVPMLMKSMAQWRHTDYCYRKVRIAKLDLTPAQCRKYTWRNAPRVKKMTSDKDAFYYRKVKQACIEDGREFFPTTFSYELPTYNFRDVYFSYVPAKEVECLAWKPWQMHEVKAKKAKG